MKPNINLISHSIPRKCVFCQNQDRQGDKCSIAADVEKRKDEQNVFNLFERRTYQKELQGKNKVFQMQSREASYSTIYSESETQSYATDESKEDSSLCLVKSSTNILL